MKRLLFVLIKDYVLPFPATLTTDHRVSSLLTKTNRPFVPVLSQVSQNPVTMSTYRVELYLTLFSWNRAVLSYLLRSSKSSHTGYLCTYPPSLRLSSVQPNPATLAISRLTSVLIHASSSSYFFSSKSSHTGCRQESFVPLMNLCLLFVLAPSINPKTQATDINLSLCNKATPSLRGWANRPTRLLLSADPARWSRPVVALRWPLPWPGGPAHTSHQGVGSRVDMTLSAYT